MRKHNQFRVRAGRVFGFSMAVVIAVTGIACGPKLSVSAAKEAVIKENETGQEGAETEEVLLRTVEDLKELSRQSVYDYYTMDKVFRLMNDIDLSGEKLDPISIFCGTFEGDGHVIKGFRIDQPGSDYGFFRFIEAQGSVRGLTVEGELKPSGTRQNIGGIAGTNRGSIVNCHFRGSIIARDTAGGIAGRNEEGGMIVDCSNDAVITTTKRCGGITGYNEGGVSGCVNRGRLNATAERVSTEEEELSLDLSLDRSKLADEEKINFTGGIAGISTGLIEDCVNYALIGYPHVGYHVGGITGYQNGCIVSSYNYGNIRGRKDVGGIAGLFEPYVQIQYAQDTLRELRGQMDSLTDSMRGLSDLTRNANDRLTDDLDQVSDSTKELKDAAREQKDYYSEQGDRFGEEYDAARDKVEDRIDKLEFEVKGEKAQKAVRAMRSDAKEMAQIMVKLAAVKEIEKQLAGGGLDADTQEKLKKALAELGSRDVLEKRLEELQEDIAKQADIVEDTVSDASEEADELRHNLKRLRSESKDWAKVIRDNARQLSEDSKDTDEIMSSQADQVYDSMDELKQGLKDSNQELTQQMEAIERQMDLVQDTISEGLNRVDERITDDDYSSFTDLSDSEEMQSQKGLIAACKNSGEIETDINGGGIAGAVAIEADIESEFQINRVGTRSLNDTGTLKATILQCENDSDVIVKNDYAGGITGRAERGAVVLCRNYGNIETTDGGYSGGIAGKSSNLIRGCYALCNVEGREYTGGIAGLGTDLFDNCAMAGVVSSTGETFGTIAGSLEGTAENNCFVEEGIPSINGLTYHSQARPVSYEELLAMEGTPDAYRVFHVKFMANDTIIKVVNCRYGESISESDIPAVPEKAGYYGVWEEEDLNRIKRNLTVHAVYDTWITTISSETLSAGNERADLLISADFYPDTTLSYETIPTENYHVGGYQTRAAYRFDLSCERQRDFGALCVRVLAPEGKRTMQAAIEQEGTMLLLDTWQDGSYLVFTMDEPGSFVIVEENPGYLVYLLAAGAAALFVVLYVRHRRKRRRKKGNNT